ncbi:hypothetical protein J7F02_10740 [Streptomyces sp. ISL-112]|uniref:hypothetical protein n=1 Tax=unclassified Streptomyces TaxID=2593676 RepID=UPI001BE842E1|nr:MULTISPECIES: hypothetical protein [unclassified Streptomyces]MBT2426141.1 hypothetical protein [Streptomyces sp. ISL-112]MBT2461320.1 hypothetical protein [Streptomyces sp. ISL-63]
MSRWDDLSPGAHKMLVDFDLDLADIAASATASIQRVRDLHRPVEHRGRTICVECSAWGNGSTDNPPTVHPCATIQSLSSPGSG